MDDFQRQCVSFIRKFVTSRLLDTTGRSVRLSAEGEDILTRQPGWMERGIGLAAALLVSPAWQDGRAHDGETLPLGGGKGAGPLVVSPSGDQKMPLRANFDPPALPAAEAKVITNFVLRIADVFARELIVRCQPPTFPPNFDMLTMVPMLELLLDRGSARQRKLWLRCAEACARVSRDFLLSKESAWGKPGPFTGCGPNHLFIIAAPLFRLGRLLDNADYCRLARRAIRKLCALQAPAGYFPEDRGPVVNYQTVSLLGLCDYHAVSGDRAVKPFLDRGLDFLLRAMYPNLAPMETIDQRNRAKLTIGQPGRIALAAHAYFTGTPAGRRLADLTIAEFLAQVEREPEKIPLFVPGQIALAALLHAPGPAAKILPCERPAFVDAFDGQAAIIRRDGWMVVLSGYYESSRTGNPFILDRTQNLSVFNDRFGLLIGGGNDKHKLDVSTIELIESGYVWYFPPIGGATSAAGKNSRSGQVELQYGAGAGRLQATIRSPRLVELLAGAKTTFSDQVNWLNLQISVGPGAIVRIDGKRVKLDAKAAEPKTWPVKKSFEPITGVVLEVPGGGQFRWPVLPWNTHNIPAHTSPITAATGYLRVSLTGQRLDDRVVRIRLR